MWNLIVSLLIFLLRTAALYSKCQPAKRRKSGDVDFLDAVSGGIWPKFKLIQAFMHVLITCKYEKDPIKNSRENVMT